MGSSSKSFQMFTIAVTDSARVDRWFIRIKPVVGDEASQRFVSKSVRTIKPPGPYRSVAFQSYSMKRARFHGEIINQVSYLRGNGTALVNRSDSELSIAVFSPCPYCPVAFQGNSMSISRSYSRERCRYWNRFEIDWRFRSIWVDFDWFNDFNWLEDRRISGKCRGISR